MEIASRKHITFVLTIFWDNATLKPILLAGEKYKSKRKYF